MAKYLTSRSFLIESDGMFEALRKAVVYARKQKASYADGSVPESERPRVGEKVCYKGRPPEDMKEDPDKKDTA